jgi:hypothetical protein
VIEPTAIDGPVPPDPDEDEPPVADHPTGRFRVRVPQARVSGEEARR